MEPLHQDVGSRQHSGSQTGRSSQATERDPNVGKSRLSAHPMSRFSKPVGCPRW